MQTFVTVTSVSFNYFRALIFCLKAVFLFLVCLRIYFYTATYKILLLHVYMRPRPIYIHRLYYFWSGAFLFLLVHYDAFVRAILESLAVDSWILLFDEIDDQDHR